MNRCVLPLITALTLICGVYLPEKASAQTTAKDLVGTWTLVSITIEQDGKKIDFYGPSPQGQETYDSNGHVSVIITRSDLPKFASNNRQSGTPEENKAVVQGSFAYFGTYSVSETATRKPMPDHARRVGQHCHDCWSKLQREQCPQAHGRVSQLHALAPAGSQT